MLRGRGNAQPYSAILMNWSEKGGHYHEKQPSYGVSAAGQMDNPTQLAAYLYAETGCGRRVPGSQYCRAEGH